MEVEIGDDGRRAGARGHDGTYLGKLEGTRDLRSARTLER